MKADVLTKASTAALRKQWMEENNHIFLDTVRKLTLGNVRENMGLPAKSRKKIPKAVAKAALASMSGTL